MKIRHLLILFLAFALIVLFSREEVSNNSPSTQHAISRFITEDKIHIRFPLSSPPEKKIADLIWIRHAAKEALNSHNPWFSIIEKNVTAEYVEGVIKLEKNPVKAEYDAQEILGIQTSKEEH